MATNVRETVIFGVDLRTYLNFKQSPDIPINLKILVI